MERFSGGWFDNRLVQHWLPAMPEVQRKLRNGADMADVGCGRGRALIRLAQAYPASRYVGYDRSHRASSAQRVTRETQGWPTGCDTRSAMPPAIFQVAST